MQCYSHRAAATAAVVKCTVCHRRRETNGSNNDCSVAAAASAAAIPSPQAANGVACSLGLLLSVHIHKPPSSQTETCLRTCFTMFHACSFRLSKPPHLWLMPHPEHNRLCHPPHTAHHRRGRNNGRNCHNSVAAAAALLCLSCVTPLPQRPPAVQAAQASSHRHTTPR